VILSGGAEPEPGDAAAQTEPDSEECFRPLALLVGLHESAITSLTCSHDSQTPVLVSTDSSGAMCVWRLEDGICLRSGHPRSGGSSREQREPGRAGAHGARLLPGAPRA
jgi:hypothetical protein